MYDAVIMKSSILLMAWGTVVEHLQSVCSAWVAAAASHHALFSSLCLAHATERVALTKVVKRHFSTTRSNSFIFPSYRWHWQNGVHHWRCLSWAVEHG